MWQGETEARTAGAKLERSRERAGSKEGSWRRLVERTWREEKERGKDKEIESTFPLEREVLQGS